MKNCLLIPFFLIALAISYPCCVSATRFKSKNCNQSSLSLDKDQLSSSATSNNPSSDTTIVSVQDCQNRQTQHYGYTILNTYKRPGQQYYTQGLTFKDANTLLESTGLYGESNIQYIDLDNMEVTKQVPIGAQYFGEGCDYIGNEIFQLTWLERKVFVWDVNTLELKRTMELPGEIKEGWGLAKRVRKDSENKDIVELYATDGSSNVYVVDPSTFTVKRTLQAKAEGCEEFSKLNELEFVNGKLWANVYYQESILMINPDDGFIEGMIDLNGISNIAKQEADSIGAGWQGDYVLNGIAYHPETEKLLITGKKWPLVWEIQINALTS